jgi:hypothetical protein
VVAPIALPPFFVRFAVERYRNELDAVVTARAIGIATEPFRMDQEGVLLVPHLRVETDVEQLEALLDSPN